MKVAVHITHESVKKIGGIGAVLSGVCNLESYKEYYDRTVFYGPLFDQPSDISSQLGKSGHLLFSSHDLYDEDNYLHVFGRILEKYNIDIVYAQRELVSEFDVSKHIMVDVINIGINKMNDEEVEKFKYDLWKDFGIKSHLYHSDWDYEQYLRIAIPFLEILDGLYGVDSECYHFAHEYMGVPSALSVLMAGRKDPTVFIGHEVTTARSLVENLPGHDISFYNILQKADLHKSLEQIFGSFEDNPRSELIKRAVNFDHIFAVGDHVKEEYQFLVPDVPEEKLDIVYNGVSARTISFEQKLQSRDHIKRYTERLLNFTPDMIFTHVTRLVTSKGIWRDISLLNSLDEIFVQRGLKGVFILLSTLIGTPRSSQDIYKMEGDYGWPVLHRNGWPDLIGAEEDVDNCLQLFNARSHAIKAVFINQFGFSKARCGTRVPADAEFADLRLASDAELGFSIYEPFGIAQIETIPFGGVSLLSSSCGSAGLLQSAFEDAPIKPFYVLDYISAGKKLSYSALKNLNIERRTQMEDEIITRHAKAIFDVLPHTDEQREQYLLNAHKYAHRLSWEAQAQKYILNLTPST